MKIEEYKLGQRVSFYGRIEAIDIANIHDKENTTTLKINTLTRTISVNPKLEEVTTDIDQPKPEVPQCAIDWVDDSRERDYEFDEWFDPDNQPPEVYKWLNCKNKRQADINALALVTLIVNGPDAVTVEKEKLYTVEMPIIHGNLFKRVVLCRGVLDNGVFINCTNDPSWKTRDKFQLTEQEIRKDFDWAFRWAEEVTE